MSRRRPAAAALAVVATALPVAVLTPAASAEPTTRVISSCTNVRHEPSHYIFFCADGGAGLKHATYKRWGETSARGSATYFFNDCKPSCAGGTFHEKPATFRLHRVVDTKKYGPLFTRVTVSTAKHDYTFQLPTRPY